ncbi:hypothetical protein [Devosia nitrariae]|uniref:DUF3137 domain-containing protein n=1 Tax=Devosia nitrariae TaxID=2071872 RepID=A0ABQ5W228_9HYPH|nr:hypothetical protein [Devosia nitrariae]GLQ54058.1 hypothetical protein GCM10010862_13170 [Devosia nitrariae]
MSRPIANGMRRKIVSWTVLIAALSLGYVSEHFGIPQDRWILLVILGVLFLAIGETQANLRRIESHLGLEHLQTNSEQGLKVADGPVTSEPVLPELPSKDDTRVSPGTRLFLEHFARFADVTNKQIGGLWCLRETAERDYNDPAYCRRYDIFYMDRRCGSVLVYDRSRLGFPYTTETPSITTRIEVRNARSFRTDYLMTLLDQLAIAGSFNEEVERVRQEIRNAMVLAMWQVGPERIVAPKTLKIRFDASAKWYLLTAGIAPHKPSEARSLRDVLREPEEGNSTA